jgi:uncharacterized protein (DUF1778 family)
MLSEQTNRLQMRLDTPTKALLERAARYKHQPLTQFVLAHVVAAAQRVVAEHEHIALSKADWGNFLTALESPPPPSAALRKAFVEYAARNAPDPY